MKHREKIDKSIAFIKKYWKLILLVSVWCGVWITSRLLIYIFFQEYFPQPNIYDFLIAFFLTISIILIRRYRFLNKILKCVRGSIIATDSKGIIRYANPWAHRMLDEERLVGKQITNFYAEPEQHSFFRQLLTGDQIITQTIENITSGGKRFPSLVVATRLNGGARSGFVGISTDITLQIERQNELESSQEALIALIVDMLGSVDPYTGKHSLEVSEIAVKVAEKMELEQNLIEAIRIAGLLHDTGKIKCHYLISRTGDLSVTEKEVVKQHPMHGYDLLKNKEIPYKEIVLDCVRQHHEHEKGYPYQIPIDQLPLHSKIMAAVDVYHALGPRPYRSKTFSLPDKIGILAQDAADRKLDPQIIGIITKLALDGEI